MKVNFTRNTTNIIGTKFGAWKHDITESTKNYEILFSSNSAIDILGIAEITNY